MSSFLASQEFDPQAFLRSLPPELATGFTEIYLQEEEGEGGNRALDIERELAKITLRLKIMNIHEQMEALTHKMKLAEKKKDESLLIKYEEEFATLSKKRSEIEGT